MYKKIGSVAFLFIGPLFIGCALFNPNPAEQRKYSTRERKIQKEVLAQMVSFRDYVKDSLRIAVGEDKIDTQKVRRTFLRSRVLFKKFEWAAAYFNADLAKRLNGPPVQEIENADLLDPAMARAVEPMGLQVLEELIYPRYDVAKKKELVDEVGHLITNSGYLISYFADHRFADWRILDAAKLEVFRIIALGITGFDTSLSLNGMEESSVSLESLRSVLAFYVDQKGKAPLLRDLDASREFLQHNPDFDSFDRAVFTTRFLNKVSSGIARLERDLPGRKIKYNRMLGQSAGTLFDSGAFNVDAFSPGPGFHVTGAKVELGKKLFYDRSLSGTGTRSCASCHDPNRAFTDGLARHTDIHNPEKQLLRNVPTLLNAALQSNYFYDMRALTLEDQVYDVIGNEHEMDGSMDTIVTYVSADLKYRSLFKRAFPETAEKGIRSDEVVNAIASYVRSLTKLNSRFDEYMHGKEDALSKGELRGYNLFTGKAKCATCHFVPLFNGITPPKYVSSETEVLGVPISPTDSILDPDLGYYDVIGVESFRHAFKVPTVRNIGKTAPYMHNGIYRTLEEVMQFYDKGGAAGLGIDLSNQTLSKENLNLSEEEKEDIIAFMKSLESK